MTLATSTSRLEIDYSVYDPRDPEFVKDPFPTFERMLTDYPVVFHTDLNGWIIAPHELAQEVTRSPRFSTSMADWKDAPPARPEAEWTLYDHLMANSMLAVDRQTHLRLRKLTAPAFSRRVMDQIEASIRDSIAEIFDEIPDPREFNVAADIALKVPVRTIARMVGVPPEAAELFEHGLAWNLVRATHPIYPADERQRYADATLPGLRYLLDFVAARRASDDPGDDFIGTLITTELDGERLSDMEILSVISALVGAGADTAVDMHTNAIYALLTHPAQRALLRARPDLHEAATLEILRWGAQGKLGSIPRFALEDTEVGGQVLEKGSFVMPIMSMAWNDPAKWPSPRTFDITRDHSGNIIFGAGPHLCLGLNLVKAQSKLMIEEFERRFGDTAEITGEFEYDPTHGRARRITRMMVRTGA